MLSPKSMRGFTLVELMITLTVLAILLGLGIPAFSNAISNAKVRSATEALQNGLRLAQAEAVRRSHQTAFVLTNSTPALSATPSANGKNWYIQVLPGPGESLDATYYVQGGAFGDQTNGVTITSAATLICFNSIGRAVDTASTPLGTCAVPAANTPITFDVTAPGADRTLRLQISAGGKIRMCDRSVPLSSTRPDGCDA